jgi:hypothetical protein
VSAPAIKCISVGQPYATWLVNPDKFVKANLTPKRIENRNWNTDYRGPILIHASKKFEDDALDIWAHRMPGIKRAISLEKTDYPLGYIVGEAELSEVITVLNGAEAANPWFCGEYGFKLKNARPIDPIPYRGQLGLFDVPRSILERSELDKDHTSSILGKCAVCQAPATVASPSDNPQSVYCRQHSQCIRQGCGRSIKSFVFSDRMGIWCCPCVVAFEQKRKGV